VTLLGQPAHGVRQRLAQLAPLDAWHHTPEIIEPGRPGTPLPANPSTSPTESTTTSPEPTLGRDREPVDANSSYPPCSGSPCRSTGEEP
jgi:hypothetical protein